MNVVVVGAWLFPHLVFAFCRKLWQKNLVGNLYLTTCHLMKKKRWVLLEEKGRSRGGMNVLMAVLNMNVRRFFFCKWWPTGIPCVLWGEAFEIWCGRSNVYMMREGFWLTNGVSLFIRGYTFYPISPPHVTSATVNSSKEDRGNELYGLLRGGQGFLGLL